MAQQVRDASQVISYRLPARAHDLIVDRKDAAASEAFLVVLKPGEAPPLEIHRGAGQVLSILDGDGELTVDETDQETFLPGVGDFVRTPPGVHHAVRCAGSSRFAHLSIGRFSDGHPTAEKQTWDSQVHVMCDETVQDCNAIRPGRMAANAYLPSQCLTLAPESARSPRPTPAALGGPRGIKSLRDVEAESQSCAGHLPFAVTSRLNTICVRAWPGETVPARVHHDEDEVYRAAPGEGVVEFGARERRISGGSDVAMSLCTEHAITNTGPESLDCVSFVVLVSEPA